MPRRGIHRRHPGQDEAQTSIPPTTSERPPRPVRGGRLRGLPEIAGTLHGADPDLSVRAKDIVRGVEDREEINRLRGRVMWLEDALVACWQLAEGEVRDPGYRDYLSACTYEEVQEILTRRPDILDPPE